MTYLTPNEAAMILRVTPRTVYEWLRTNQLKGRKMGNSGKSLWRIPVGEVAAKKDEK